MKKCDVNKYYSLLYYSDMVIGCSSYFKEFRLQLCTLVATCVADKSLHFLHKEPNSKKVSQTKLTSKREHNGLQYLAGYVIFKRLKKNYKR